MAGLGFVSGLSPTFLGTQVESPSATDAAAPGHRGVRMAASPSNGQMSRFAVVGTPKDYTAGGVPAFAAKSGANSMSAAARVVSTSKDYTSVSDPTADASSANGPSASPLFLQNGPELFSPFARQSSTSKDYTIVTQNPSPVEETDLAGYESYVSRYVKVMRESALDSVAPTVVKVDFSRGKYKKFEFFRPVGGVTANNAQLPRKTSIPLAVDQYLADKLTSQYKAIAGAGNGVYTLLCAEGAVAGQAEERRVNAGYANFRKEARPVNVRMGDYFETRKRAMIAASGCNYEESLINTFPIAAEAYVLGKAEADMTCARYAKPGSVEEAYMANSVHLQMQKRASPTGVYPASCTEGATKGAAETARVMALGKDFRLNQLSTVTKERAKFESRRNAIANYANGCSHEETQFSQYPAAAATMRPRSSGY